MNLPVSRTSNSTKILFKKLFLLFPGIFLLALTGYAQGTWFPVTNPAPHVNGGVMLLLSDGSVLVKTKPAVYATYGAGWDRLTPDIHGSYSHGTWDTIASMHDTRQYFSSQVLRDGRVYIAGGEQGTGIRSGETYNPLTNTWTMVPPFSMVERINDAISEMLPDGRVLQNMYSGRCDCLAGFGNIIYNPVTNTYDTADTCLGGQQEATWVKLSDNSILTVDVLSRNSERYIPSMDMWIPDDTLPVMLWTTDMELGAGILLPDGRALFWGSTPTTAYYTPSGTLSPGTWAAGPTPPYCRFSIPAHVWSAKDAPVAMMNNGKIFCVFEPDYGGGGAFGPPSEFFEFDYLTNTYTPVFAPSGDSTMDVLCGAVNMLDLPDGSVLVSTMDSAKYYTYKPGGSPLVAGKPTIDSILKVTCDTFTITGKLFNGISEGAGYGDDAQMSTNYPIVRLTLGTSVYYALSFNWNRTGVMTGALPDTATFVLPATLPDGLYGLQVIANGIASNPRPFATCGAITLGTDLPGPSTDNIRIYPNPAKTATNLVFDSREGGKYTIKLVDVFGRVINERTTIVVPGENNLSISVKGLPTGVYTVLIQDNEQVYSTKLVIK